MYGKSNVETYITICKIANGNVLYGSGNSNRMTLRDVMEREVGGRFKGRRHVYTYG